MLWHMANLMTVRVCDCGAGASGWAVYVYVWRAALDYKKRDKHVLYTPRPLMGMAPTWATSVSKRCGSRRCGACPTRRLARRLHAATSHKPQRLLLARGQVRLYQTTAPGCTFNSRKGHLSYSIRRPAGDDDPKNQNRYSSNLLKRIILCHGI